MKKILAFLLAAVMVIGMGATGFADWLQTNEQFTADTNYSAATIGTKNVTVTMKLSDLVADSGKAVTGDAVTSLKAFTLAAANFTEGVKNEANENAIDVVDWDVAKDSITLTLALTDAGRAKASDGDRLAGSIIVKATDVVNYTWAPTPTTTATDGDLTWTCNFDFVIIDLGVTTVDGDDADAITDFAANKSIAEEVTKTGKVPADDFQAGNEYGRINLGKMRPIDEPEVRFYLRSDMFAGTGYNPDARDEYLGQTAVRANRMSARIQVAKGSGLIKSGPTIKYDDNGEAYIDIDFLDELTSIDDESFEFTIALSIDGKRKDRNGEACIVVGSLENVHVRVNADWEDFDMSEQDVIQADEFDRDIRLDLGAGVSVYTKLFKGAEYYGIAKREPDEADDVVMAAYPDIDNVVHIYSDGISSTGNVVGFNTDNDEYYVYDEELNLLGMSDELVEFRPVYYLANRPIDVDVDVEPIDPPVDSEPLPPAGTGGDMAPTNANANPGTGF